jgi:predicted amidohydrolase YtcJ
VDTRRHARPADLFFTGGPVYTADPARRSMTAAAAGRGSPRAAAVAVRDGRIVAVGGAREIGELTGPRTEGVDLRGRALLPGFQDAHVHPAFAGVTMMRCDLAGAGDAAGALARIAAYAREHPGQEWISGSGWSMEWFPGGTPGRELLDSVVGSRPAYLTNRDGHGAWASSRALELAGLDDGTPDPPDGRIERAADGAPQGTLHEGAAVMVGRLVPAPTPDESRTGLLRAQQHLHSLGITAWQDAIVGDYLGHADPLPVYLAAAAAGQLTARVEGALWWDRGRGAEQLADLLSRRELAARAAGASQPGAGQPDSGEPGRGQPGGAGRFLANTVKIMQDGVAENFTAGLLEPYLDGCGCQTGNSGLSYVDPQELREQVTRLDAAGFGVHFHAIGDRAVREALDAVAAARAANGATPGRHHIAHLQVVHGDDIPRFRELGVTANMQALWAVHEPQMDEFTIPFLGPERSARQYPFGDLLRSGAGLAAGSDWAVSSANPLWGIHVAVNRTLPPGAGDPATEPLLPGQALSLGEALAAYTAGSAQVNNLDATGAIEPGMLADLIVVDRDPFAGPSGEIGDTTVLLTYVGGERVYSAESA